LLEYCKARFFGDLELGEITPCFAQTNLIRHPEALAEGSGNGGWVIAKNNAIVGVEANKNLSVAPTCRHEVRSAATEES
jgi:hypothetical protein